MSDQKRPRDSNFGGAMVTGMSIGCAILLVTVCWPRLIGERIRDSAKMEANAPLTEARERVIRLDDSTLTTGKDGRIQVEATPTPTPPPNTKPFAKVTYTVDVVDWNCTLVRRPMTRDASDAVFRCHPVHLKFDNYTSTPGYQSGGTENVYRTTPMDDVTCDHLMTHVDVKGDGGGYILGGCGDTYKDIRARMFVDATCEEGSVRTRDELCEKYYKTRPVLKLVTVVNEPNGYTGGRRYFRFINDTALESLH